MWRPSVKITILLVVTGAILAGVMYFVGFEKTWQAVVEAGLPAFLSTGVFLAALIFFQAVAWKYLNGSIGHKVPFGVLVQATIVGQAGNTLTPSTYLGGEPARILFVGKLTGLSYGELTGTVLLGKYLEALSFVAFLLVCAVVTMLRYWRTLFEGAAPLVGVSLVVILALLIALAVALIMTLQRGWTPLAGLILLGERMRIFPRALRRLRRRTVGAEKQASRVFRQEERVVLPCLITYLLTHLLMFAKPFAFFWLGWRLGLDAYELALIFVTCQVLLAFQLTPSGVGTLDGGMFGMISLANIPITSPQCAAYLLSLRFWDFALIALGALLTARAGAELLAKAPAPAPPGAAKATSARRDKP